MKNSFKFFALLDLINFVFLTVKLVDILGSGAPIERGSAGIYLLGLVALDILLLTSAIGLFKMRGFGMLAYYVQIPMRILFAVFSFSVLTVLPELFNRYEDFWFEWIYWFCLVAEFVRLYFTVQFHRRRGRLSHSKLPEGS